MHEDQLIICLANSRKLSGRCVAGKLIGGREVVGWVRPVSAAENGEICQQDTCYEDGTEAQVLDLISLTLLEPVPDGHQQENWLFDPQFWWTREGVFRKKNLGQIVDDGPIWLDGFNTENGKNDKVPMFKMSQCKDSLRLICVNRLQLVVGWFESRGRRKRRVQGRFRHRGSVYWLWVTDPIYEQQYLSEPNGAYDLHECYLTISLSEPIHGGCYKLIAAIIEVN